MVRPDAGGLYPFGPMGRAAFLVKKAALDAIGITFECKWPVFQMGQQNGGDVDVIIDDLPFGEAGLRIENFVEIRNGDRFSVDVEGGFAFRGLGRARAPHSGWPICCP